MNLRSLFPWWDESAIAGTGPQDGEALPAAEESKFQFVGVDAEWPGSQSTMHRMRHHTSLSTSFESYIAALHHMSTIL